MKAWNLYCRKVLDVDPNQVWVDLCSPEHIEPHRTAQRRCQAFLEDYIEQSKELRPSLGPEEYVEARGVTAAMTVLKWWGSLVCGVETTFLRDMRTRDPANREKWRLLSMIKKEGPVAQINQWIAEKLSDKYGLTRNQLFDKSKATAKDILLILETLWRRAKAIICSSEDRAAFHSVVLINSIGGFRPGTLMEFKYDQVELGFVRDPHDRTKRRLVATLLVLQNKRKEKIINFSQNHKVSFSITFMPFRLICLLRLIVARVIKDDAFEASFKSAEELFRLPILEDTDYVKLNWKAEIRGKCIFPIKYGQFLKIWNRTNLVAGFRVKLRPYSMRVGAGGRIDGSLIAAVRNYVLSNTDSVFQNSYQPVHVRENLMSIAFGNTAAGAGAGQRDKDFFELLRRSSLMRDDGAPIEPPKDALDEWEKRADISGLRREIEEAKTTCDGGEKAKRIEGLRR